MTPLCHLAAYRLSISPDLAAYTLSVGPDLAAYTLSIGCRFGDSAWFDLRVHYSVFLLAAFVLSLMQCRRCELICRYDFIWKLQVSGILTAHGAEYRYEIGCVSG